MDLQPFLENELIFLRPLEESDFEPLYRVAQDPLIWEQHPSKNRYQKEVYSDFFIDSMESKGALIVIDKSTNEIIGSTRFKIIDNAQNAIEIGWSFLSRRYWGGMYNKSIKELMTVYAFQFVDDVVFYIGPENIRSQKAVEKIGGARITESHFAHLFPDNKDNWTYKMSKTQCE